MKIGLFLDVDITLTTDYIQDVFARELGLEKRYIAIEKHFQKTGDTEKFGKELSELFAEQHFTRSRAEELFDKVVLRSYVKRVFELQKKGVDIYLVSSGPNYYIEALAENMEMPWRGPRKRVLCSEYEFKNKNVISGCPRPVGKRDKIAFVRETLAREKYDFSIGIGDDEEQDAFVTLCLLPIFTSGKKRQPDGSIVDVEASENFLYVAKFDTVLGLIDVLLELSPRAPHAENQPKSAGPILIPPAPLAPPVPRWFGVAAAVFTASFFLALFYLLIVGLPIDASRRLVFDVWVALSVSAGTAFLTGNAAASGKIPFLKNAPIQFTAIGGVAIFIVVFLILHKLV